MGKQFSEFVSNILRQELAIGLAVAIHGSAAEMVPLLQKSEAEYAADVDFNWVTPDGVIAHAGEPAYQGADLSGAPFFRRIQNGAPYDLSDLRICSITGEPVFSITRPVNDPEGSFLGAVVAVVHPASLDEMFHTRKPGDRAVGIIDRNARAVSRYPPVAWTWEKRDLSETYPVITEALAGKEVTAVLPSVEGRTARMVSYSPVEAFGWVSGASLPVAAVEGPILTEIFSHAALFAILASLALAVALYISARITDPIQKLRRLARDLGQGKTEGAIEIEGPAELQALAHSFNTMALEIDLREEQIERERTRAQELAFEMSALAHDRTRLFNRMNALVKTSAGVLSETTREGILQRVVDAAREITGTRLGTSGHGYLEGTFQVGAASRSDDAPPCPPGEVFQVHRGGVYRDLVEKQPSIRLSQKELQSHPAWWGLPDNHTPLNGLLGARLTGENGKATGLIMVSDPEGEGFTEEDEMLLRELASLTSLGLRHIESREGVERQVADRTRELRNVNERLTAEITERRTAEEALEYQREILQKIIDNIPVMLCLYDETGRMRLINPEFERRIGWSLEELGRVDVMETCYPDPELREEVWNFMMSASREWRDFRLVNRHGEAFDTSWANVRLSDGSQIGIGIDVSWRYRAEAALREYAAKLEWSNRELQDFAFVASHDLQEPLRKVQAFGDLLDEEFGRDLGAEGRDYVDRMRKAAARMKSLINALLSYSRVTTEAKPFEPVDLALVLREVLSDLDILMEKTAAHVEVGDLPTIEADPVQMEQLFLNLIGNALKFRGEPPPRIRVHQEPDGRSPADGSTGGRWCRISVSDNGIGIPERHRDKIFIPFQRLHSRNDYEGTGMGLAICRKIVARHHGEITAGNNPEGGATFTVVLPEEQEKAVSGGEPFDNADAPSLSIQKGQA